MNILDLDLDFFQHGRIVDCFGCRSADGVLAWSKDEVIQYLEMNLNLKGKKIPGKIFEKHNQAFSFWNELINETKLAYPFHVDHVDAHGDLCIGYMNSLWDVFFNNHVKNFFSNRSSFPLNEMNEGNYLCYALVKQWIASLNFIYNDGNGTFDGIDHINIFFENIDVCDSNLQIHLFDRFDVHDLLDPQIMRSKIIKSDNSVPFKRICGKEYKSDLNYDFINLSISPDFIVEESRCNIDIIANYIDQI